MKKIVLGHILFDFSGGEYESTRVRDIFLGVCELEDEKEIQAYAHKLLEEYVEANESYATMYEGALRASTFTIKEI
jgi:hypothetical protein